MPASSQPFPSSLVRTLLRKKPFVSFLSYVITLNKCYSSSQSNKRSYISNMKAETKSEKLDKDDQSSKCDMLLSSVVKQLKDYSTFSETHCTTRESQSDAINTLCQVRRKPLPGWKCPAAHALLHLRWIRRCRGLPGRIHVAATFPARSAVPLAGSRLPVRIRRCRSLPGRIRHSPSFLPRARTP
jgi:hypothetical protein